MNYDLAKQLKEKKFPLREDFNYETIAPDKGNGEWLPIPTLSELIEACGDDTDGNKNVDHPFSSLNLLADFKTWEAEAWFTTKIGKGSTPEEAVALLWLELNKK